MLHRQPTCHLQILVVGEFAIGIVVVFADDTADFYLAQGFVVLWSKERSEVSVGQRLITILVEVSPFLFIGQVGLNENVDRTSTSRQATAYASGLAKT